jgi:hypothetical protein
MTVPAYTGCPWPIDVACDQATWDAYPSAVQDRAVALASDTLHRLTAYRVGGCSTKVRPCRQRCLQGFVPFYGSDQPFYPNLDINGRWVNTWCGCQTSCSCSIVNEVVLPGPVGRVDEIKLDGAVVDPADYRLDNQGRVVYTGTGDGWPLCQDMHLPDTQPGTFSITYLQAYPVDALGAYAAGLLALEYAKACTTGKCALPTGVTQLIRQGVVMTINSGAFPDGLTGLREVDAFIGVWNPNKLKQAPRVWSPDSDIRSTL